MSAPQPALSRERRRRVAGSVTALSVAVSTLVVWPVMRAPIEADDRYWYMSTFAQAKDSVWGVFTYTWQQLPQDIRFGRVDPLASVARRLVSLTVARLSIATGVEMAVYVSAVKLALFFCCLLSCLALVASLRRRAADGTLRRISPWTLWFVGVTGLVVFATGAQVSGFGNGWTAYPVLTYGCLVTATLVTVLVLVLTRLVARRPQPLTRGLAVAAMVVVALMLSISYELAYVAVPLAVVALLLQPVGAGATRRASWVARATTGIPLVATFLAAATAGKAYATARCVSGCYAGVRVHLVPQALRTLVYNTFTPAPLPSVRLVSQYATGAQPGGWSLSALLASGGAVVVVLGAWWVAREPTLADAEGDGATWLLWQSALLFLVLAVGVAAIASVAVQPQQLITSFTVPYRNMVMTWAGLSLALVTTWAALFLQRGHGPVPWIAVAVAMGVVAAVMPVRNAQALRAELDSPGTRAVRLIQKEAVTEDLTPAGNARRCAALRALRTAAGRYPRFTDAADAMYRQAYGRPFCTPPPA